MKRLKILVRPNPNTIIVNTLIHKRILKPFYGFYFQSFKNHKLCNVLEDPGRADVTANVDFAFLEKAAGSKGLCCNI